MISATDATTSHSRASGREITRTSSFTKSPYRQLAAPRASRGTTDSGVIAWFNSEHGYGYIVPDGDGPDVFVHVSQLGGRDPEVGQRVSYRVSGSEGRPAAKNVHLLRPNSSVARS